ncbi:uncharacterized protein PgNI_04866 [Pyricularia grisea]|uniref:GID complex catalytic subunit 2 n=1 Tax=Pyricularia grisea TaxID=148305 RepID=A0A6P8BDY8_PYRGI|nr:uncharacterized protein PgNI_04866 [Pyricularia grisea]TLD14030.1 hypothetical protein PgNI_04866 [Pyricularia grisea]
MSKTGVAIPQLQKDLEGIEEKPRLSLAVDNIDRLIAKLTEARQAVATASDPHTASLTLTRLQNPVKEVIDRANDDLKKVYQVQKDLGKSLDKSFPVVKIATDHDALDGKSDLMNKAIAMHLMREGQFSVASTFIGESQRDQHVASLKPQSVHGKSREAQDSNTMVVDSDGDINQQQQSSSTVSGQTNASSEVIGSSRLQEQFEVMYRILQELKQHNLQPAIEWALANSTELEARGSNLEFELCRLQYVHLFETPGRGPPAAFEYARTQMWRFRERHLAEITRLAGALIYAPNLADSPYATLFDSPTAFLDAASSFTREFCSLLGLSAESPLYVAATAGAIALPRLVKWQSIAQGAEWTTTNELAFETPLPRSFMYHSIFVCPVSKEQTTAANPPVILPCGHVLARDSLTNIAKGTRFKCPYCPSEGQVKDARVIVL